MIELVGLDGKADRPIKGFSGGEHQRLGIAQAEVNYPDLLILDEPTASLDPQGRRDVLEVMSRIRKYATIFYCTHILDDVQRVSDQVAVVNQGELITQAPIEELLAGTGELTYSVTLKGDTQSAYAQATQQPWVSGIESSFRGVLLSKMEGVIGKWGWVANGVLFSLYHLHQPWGILAMAPSDPVIAYSGKRFHSNRFPIILHSGQSIFYLFLILGLVLGLA